MKRHYDIKKDHAAELREKILGLGESSLRKNYYPELLNRKDQLESILRAAPVGIGMIVEHIIQEANDSLCKILGYTKKALVGKHIKYLYGSFANYDCEDSQNIQQLEEAGIYTVERSWSHSDGNIIIVLLSFSPLDKNDVSRGVTFTAFDISERKSNEQSLYFEKERLRITLQSIGDGVIATDKDGKIMMMNPASEEITGWTQHVALGMMIQEVFNVIDTDNKEGLVEHSLLLSKNGEKKAIADSIAPIKDQDGVTVGTVYVFRDITEEKNRQQEILWLSYYDKLTGLYNRSFFERELVRLDTEKQLPLSIILGDINGLKLTNDVFGHHEGDKLLQTAAKIMKKVCRKEDIVARWGGDEFIILLPQTSETTAWEVCTRIVHQCQQEEGQGVRTSISLGYASKNSQEDDIMQLLKKAEDMMYQQKLLESRSLRNTTIHSIKRTLSEKSYETDAHAERLKEMCEKIGIFMGLSEIQLYELELLAVLHDIGKIAIKDSVLQKSGRLTEDEWTEMKRHPEIGYRIVQSVPELSQIAEYILSHHERWDGSGYPRGIEGENIPLLSRILAVVDAYDAMTNDRAYRKALNKDEVMSELRSNAGTQFDPNIVKIFIDKVLS